MQFLIHIVSSMGYLGVFLWMAVSACIPIPSEAVLPLAGAMIVTNHAFNLQLLAFTGALGNLIGSMIAYGIGAKTGRGFFEKYGRYLMIRKSDMEMGDRWFAKHGEATVFFTRMMPVVRAVISYPAGIAKMPFGKFCAYSFLGGLPWCYFLAWIGIQLGNQWPKVQAYFHKADMVIGVLVVLAVAFWVWRHLGPEHSEMKPVETEKETA